MWRVRADNRVSPQQSRERSSQRVKTNLTAVKISRVHSHHGGRRGGARRPAIGGDDDAIDRRRTDRRHRRRIDCQRRQPTTEPWPRIDKTPLGRPYQFFRGCGFTWLAVPVRAAPAYQRVSNSRRFLLWFLVSLFLSPSELLLHVIGNFRLQSLRLKHNAGTRRLR